MSFRVEYLQGSGNYEVVMEAGTVHRGHERRIAMCSHENDADTIAMALNRAEKEGWLKNE